MPFDPAGYFEAWTAAREPDDRARPLTPPRIMRGEDDPDYTARVFASYERDVATRERLRGGSMRKRAKQVQGAWDC